jgi:hypothetical protein
MVMAFRWQGYNRTRDEASREISGELEVNRKRRYAIFSESPTHTVSFLRHGLFSLPSCLHRPISPGETRPPTNTAHAPTRSILSRRRTILLVGHCRRLLISCSPDSSPIDRTHLFSRPNRIAAAPRLPVLQSVPEFQGSRINLAAISAECALRSDVVCCFRAAGCPGDSRSGAEMGVYLSTPKTDKVSADGGNDRLRFGLSSMQGWRTTMEDAVSFNLPPCAFLFRFPSSPGRMDAESTLELRVILDGVPPERVEN